MESVKQPQRLRSQVFTSPPLQEAGEIGDILAAMENAQSTPPTKAPAKEAELDDILTSMQKIEQPRSKPTRTKTTKKREQGKREERTKKSKGKGDKESSEREKRKPKEQAQTTKPSSSGDLELDILLASMDATKTSTGGRVGSVVISYSDIEGQLAALDKESAFKTRGSVVSGDIWMDPAPAQATKLGMSDFDDLLASLDAPLKSKGEKKSTGTWKARTATPKQSPPVFKRDARRDTMTEIDNIISSLSHPAEEGSEPSTPSSPCTYLNFAGSNAFAVDLDALITDLQSNEYSNIDDLLKDLQ
jgi:hypothetical protein